MKIARTVKELRKFLEPLGRERVGFVPTMGYLHEGHLSLVKRSRAECDLTVVSIFVNPAQFGPNEDLDRYPRDEERDRSLLEKEGVDLLFLPSVDEMYPPGFAARVEVPGLSERLCGAFRPGHFSGVCTVVLKLFEMVRPARAYFGLKDAQQFLILRRMVRDLNLPVAMIGCPTIREGDGLARSSRNVYLSEEERSIAPVIYRALTRAADRIESAASPLPSAGEILAEVRSTIESAGPFKIDYVQLVDPETLCDLKEARLPCLLAVAAWLGRTRLIDNILLGLDKGEGS